MACSPIPLRNSMVNWNTQEAIKLGWRVSVLEPTAVVRGGMETIPGLCDIIRHEVIVAKKAHAQISQELQDSFRVSKDSASEASDTSMRITIFIQARSSQNCK